MSSLLQVKDLGVTYPGQGGGFRAVSDMNFEVEAGQTLALVGESGCGKSTVAKCLVALIAPTDGQVLIDGQDIAGLKGAEMRAFRSRIQMVFQDPYGSLDPRLSAGALVAEAVALRHADWSKAKRLAEAERFLDQVGLPAGSARKKAPEFSGGQRQRIGIARALAARPEIIVLDEATSALDVSVQAEILKLLRELQEETSVSYVMISHNLGVVREVADQVVVMRRGRVEEAGETRAVLDTPRAEYTRLLRAAALDPTTMQGVKPRDVVRRFGRLAAGPGSSTPVAGAEETDAPERAEEGNAA
jgi:ABC-type glutathione transport system ATPase component